MTKITLSTVLITAILGSLNAATIEELTKDALINTAQHQLSGTFGKHDFAGVDSAFDWAFTTANGASYQLKGNAPSAGDAFGWKSAGNIPAPTPLWYMFAVDIDGDGTKGPFEWVLLSTDMSKKSAYKLAGANDNGTFAYSGKIDIDYTIDGNTITTGAVGTLDDEPADTCANGCSAIDSANLSGHTVVAEYHDGAKVQNIEKASYIFLPNMQAIIVFDLFDGSRKVARGTYYESDGNNAALITLTYDNGDEFPINIFAAGISSPSSVDLITVGVSSTIPYKVTAILNNDDNGIDESSVTNIVVGSSTTPDDTSSPLYGASNITIYNNGSATEIGKTDNTLSMNGFERYDSSTPLHCTNYGFDNLVLEDTSNGVYSKTYMKNLSNMCMEFDMANSPYPGNTNTAFYK